MVKILNLVLYSDNEHYNNMYCILSNYYKKFNNVKTYFYKFNNTIENDFELIDDILNIKGTESMVPGVLDKTLKTFKYFEKEYENYDYVIRSSISTIVDFILLSIELEKNPIEYYGSSHNICLQWLDYIGGIVDNKYFNTFFASGTNIILSKKGYKLLLDNVNLIDKTIIDDVAIGVLFKNINIHHTNIAPNKFIFVPVLNDINNFNNLIDKEYIVYRNRNDVDRNIDVKQMKIITDLLSEKYI
jgi:DNA-binding ferritin-like protein (Dps family)